MIVTDLNQQYYGSNPPAVVLIGRGDVIQVILWVKSFMQIAVVQKIHCINNGISFLMDLK